MTVRVRFRREAEADVIEAFAWYRDCGLGLGEEFLRSLESCLAAIQRLP
jgi:plasmid stabilization system protein ParE